MHCPVLPVMHCNGQKWSYWQTAVNGAVMTVKAYHLKWQELPLDANIKKWSVHVLNLDRQKRHLDRATLNQFWEILDRLVAVMLPSVL